MGRRVTHQAFENTGTLSSNTGSHIPQLVLQLGELQRIDNLLRAEVAIDILLVGKHQQKRILHFAVVDNLVQFGTGLFHTGRVTRVDNENQSLGT